MSSQGRPYSELIHKAMDFAAIKHHGQMRKNKHTAIPYISHCAAVGQLLERAGFDEEVVAAGILHDTVEDAGVTLEELKEVFNNRIVEMVNQVTEQDKKLPWEERKKRYLEGLEQASFDALAVACADKTHNLWSLIFYHREGHDPWAILNKKSTKEKQVKRMHLVADLFKRRFPHPMRALFEEALEQVEKEC